MVVETIKLEAFKATTGILMPKLINFNKKWAASRLKWFLKAQPIKAPLSTGSSLLGAQSKVNMLTKQ